MKHRHSTSHEPAKGLVPDQGPGRVETPNQAEVIEQRQGGILRELRRLSGASGTGTACRLDLSSLDELSLSFMGELWSLTQELRDQDRDLHIVGLPRAYPTGRP